MYNLTDDCDSQVRVYETGKTLEDCKELAELFNPHFKEHVEKNEKLLWTEILE